MNLSLAVVTKYLKLPIPDKGDKVDSSLHQYAVATDSEKFFKSERTRLLDEILGANDDAFNTAQQLIDTANTNNKAQQSSILNGKIYDLELNVSRPYQKFDKEILKHLLIKETKLSPADVNRLFKLSTGLGSPRRTFKVQER